MGRFPAACRVPRHSGGACSECLYPGSGIRKKPPDPELSTGWHREEAPSTPLFAARWFMRALRPGRESRQQLGQLNGTAQGSEPIAIGQCLEVCTEKSVRRLVTLLFAVPVTVARRPAVLSFCSLAASVSPPLSLQLPALAA